MTCFLVVVKQSIYQPVFYLYIIHQLYTTDLNYSDHIPFFRKISLIFSRYTDPGSALTQPQEDLETYFKGSSSYFTQGLQSAYTGVQSGNKYILEHFSKIFVIIVKDFFVTSSSPTQFVTLSDCASPRFLFLISYQNCSSDDSYSGSQELLISAFNLAIIFSLPRQQKVTFGLCGLKYK